MVKKEGILLKEKLFHHWNTASQLLKSAWKYDHKLIYFICGIILIGWLAPLTGSFLPAAVIAILTEGCEPQRLIKYVAGIWGSYGILEAIRIYMFERREEILYPFRIAVLNRKMIHSSLQCDYQLYERAFIQSLQKRAMTALRGSRFCSILAFFDDLEDLGMCVLGLIVYALLLSNIHIAVVIMVLLLAVINYLIYEKYYRQFIKERENYRNHQLHVEYFSGLAYDAALGKDIRLYQSHPMLKAAFQKINKRGRSIIYKQESANMKSDIWGEIISCLRDAICYGVLIYLMLKKQMTIAEFVLYISAVTGLSEHFFGVIEIIARMNTTLTYAEDYFKSLDLMQPMKGTLSIQNDSLDIILDHVSFEYEDSGRKIFRDLNLRIRSGEKIALVGLNGAGKTTLVKLICGLYHPTSGRILINGIDLEWLKKEEYHKKIGVFFQDSKEFSFTIGENVSGLSEDEYDEVQVSQVLEKVGLFERVNSLKKGVHTYIGKEQDKEGIHLSGGELQKLLLARSLYHNPLFVILDEPASALDALSEQKLYESYNELIDDRGALFISHRLASTKFCNKILLMKDGMIIEEGSHDSLMAAKGTYYQLYTIQSQYYKEKGELDS